MKVAPITIRLATRITSETHRRAPSLTGAMWAVGLIVNGDVVGCAVVGRPKARKMDSSADEPKTTLEVVRVAVPEGLRVGQPRRGVLDALRRLRPRKLATKGLLTSSRIRTPTSPARP